MNNAANDFTSRMQQILIRLLEQKGPVPLKILAEEMEISRRTVQRELESIDRPLAKYGITFRSKVGSGIWLEGSPADREALLSALKANDSMDVTDRQERRKRLVLEILKDKTVKKLYYYSNLFGVSEATVSSDLEAVESWLAGFKLKVVRKPGFGVSIDGSEADFRSALRAFIGENINTELIRNLYQSRSLSDTIDWEREKAVVGLVRDKGEKNIYRVLDENTMRRVVSCIQKVQDKRLQNLTENSYTGLVIHVTIAINRILGQELMEANPELLAGLTQDEDFMLAGEITRRLEEEFAIAIPKEETAYICLHIKGGKVQQYEVERESGEQILKYRELLDAVNEMIDRYDPKVAYALKQDEEFVVHGLIAHLQPTLVRLQNHMKIQNPLLDHIKQEYAEIYGRCLDVAKVIKERFGYEVPETEIGFLAIHFGAAMVRLGNRKESKRKVLIGVVCASGIGISRLMVSKMNHHFLDRVEITAYGTYDLNPYTLEQLDFLVSTLPIKESIETLFVGPLLTEEEMDRIERRVRFYERTPKRKKEDNEFTRQLDQVNYVAVEIRSMIKEVGYLKVDPAIGFEELLVQISEMLTPYSDQQRSIEQDIRCREALGTQIFPDFGFALLHTKTSGVKRPCFLVCQAEGNAVFSDPYFQRIQAAVVMLMPDDEHLSENREILGFLSETLVEEDEFLETVQTGSREEIQAELSKYLKRFFNQYLDRV